LIKKIKSKFYSSEDKKNLINNYLSLSVLQGANFIIPLIILPYLVRTLGADTFGLVMFAQAFILFFNVIVDFGFSLSGVREISINRDNHQKLEEIFNSIMVIKLILIVVSFIIMLGIIETFERFTNNYILYLVTFGWVIGQALFPIWFFQGIEKMKYITIFKVLSQLLSLVAIVIFVNNPNDYLLVPLFNSLGFIVVGIISIIIILKEFKFQLFIPKFNILGNYFKESSHFFLSRVAVSIYTSSNAFVLGLFTNNTIVGYYSIAEKLYIALQALYMPIVNVLYPYISKNKNVTLFKKIFKITILFNFLLIIGLYFIAPFLVELISGKQIIESIEVFRIFLMVTMIVVPSILIGYPFLASLGYKNYANYSVVVGSIFHILGLTLLALSHIINIYTIVIVLFLTELIVLSIRIFGIKKYKLWSKI